MPDSLVEPLLLPLDEPEPPWWAGVETVRRTCIGFSGQSSPSGRGISMTSSGLPRPWKNQLWFSNWIHAAARTLRVSAGLKLSRVINSSETSRGLGSYRRGGFSGRYFLGSMLRPNSVPVEPISGSRRSFHLPSGRRAFLASGGGSCSGPSLIFVPASNRFQSRRSSRCESRLSALSDVVGSWYHCRFLLIRLKTELIARFGSDLLTAAPAPCP